MRNDQTLPWRRTSLVTVAATVLLLAAALLVAGQAAHAAGTTWYVSKAGGGGDGRSWATAWAELDRIDWAAVQPGDTILVDGGASQMTYTTSLTVGRSGASGAPITIRVADEAGHNGTAVIFGGRSTPLPACGQTSYSYQTAGVRTDGIVIGAYSWLVIDGGRRSGLVIHGHNGHGITFRSAASSHVTVRNAEIYDNGTASQSGGSWRSDEEGVELAGYHHTFERLLVHDNGQDQFQDRGAGVGDLTIRDSWLFNRRPNPSAAGLAFNFCTHNDGLQIWGGGAQSGLLVERSVVGPLQSLGIYPGDSGTGARVDDVTIRDVLLENAASNSILSDIGLRPTGWVIQHVTSFLTHRAPDGSGHCGLELDGSGHTVTDSIFYGGCFYVPDGIATAAGNCAWDNNDTVPGARVADPRFVGPLPTTDTPTFDQVAGADYALQPTSPCLGKGSAITSTAALLAEIDRLDAASGPAPTTTPPTTTPATTPPTTTSTTTTSTTTTSTTTTTTTTTVAAPPVITMEAERGALRSPFMVAGGAVLQTVETADPAKGGRAAYTFSLPSPASYVVRMVVDAADLGSNSAFVNIDAEPTAPTAIWDADPTTGFATRTVSWRGNGTFDHDQFVPKVFTLGAGQHTLIVRGREADFRIDRITLQPLL